MTVAVVPIVGCTEVRVERGFSISNEFLPVAALAATTPDGVNWLMQPTIRSMAIGRTMLGPAVTCRCEENENGTLHAALEDCQPGEVLVVETQPGTRVASFGGLMASYAERKGLAGVVVDGYMRDLGDLLDLSLPVWARGTAVGSPGKAPRGAIQIPIECGGVRVSPGDLVAGDADGVIVVPQEARTSVLTRAREIVAWESEIANRMIQGESLENILGLLDEEQEYE